MKGISELGQEFPKLKLQLDPYKDDIFYEESKNFIEGISIKKSFKN